MTAAMTEALFRDDAALLQCRATVTAVGPAGIALDRTVFYPQGGGQAGDSGQLRRADGATLAIADTRKGADAPADGAGEHILHRPAPGSALAGWAPGQAVTAVVDADRRQAHRRFHTATHLLCALLPYPVDGCSVTAAHARLDFHTAEPLDRAALDAGLARLVAAAHPVRARWISAAELDAQPALVRSLRVQPPRSGDGAGRVRLVEVEGLDLQPCGGTHVANTAEVGAVVVTKIEKKSARIRRVVLGFADAG